MSDHLRRGCSRSGSAKSGTALSLFSPNWAPSFNVASRCGGCRWAFEPPSTSELSSDWTQRIWEGLRWTVSPSYKIRLPFNHEAPSNARPLIVYVRQGMETRHDVQTNRRQCTSVRASSQKSYLKNWPRTSFSKSKSILISAHETSVEFGPDTFEM
jgi:hypothetical protein